MFRPTGFVDLAGKRVGIFGYGIEGRATRRRIEGLAQSVVVVDDDASVADVIATSGGGLDALLGCDVVLKSPGIPRRRADVLDLEAHGVAVTSSLNLWLHDADRSRVVGITGTKGKSTTTALTTYFLECLGEEATRLGNIGQPPYDPGLDLSYGWLVLEVSVSRPSTSMWRPGLVVVTSMGSDHLDWHGTIEDYRRDKLSLTRAAGDHRTIVPENATFRELADQIGGELTFVGPDETGLASSLGLLGAHSDSNVALALLAAAQLTERSAADVREHVLRSPSSFEPLRGRLTLIATEHVGSATLRYVDDGLATSALPVVAALDVFTDESIALIVGGFDRGVDYASLTDTIAARGPSTVLITMGDAGRRIGEAVATFSPHVAQVSAPSMREAVLAARHSLADGGVILLSPGAPSFDRYKSWEERSDDFTTIVNELTGG